jgi:hypothetical protein
LLAAHALGRQGHVLVHGQNEHALGHGKELLKDYIYREFLEKEKAAIDPKKRKIMLDDMLTGLFHGSFLTICEPLNEIPFWSMPEDFLMSMY